MIYIYMRVSQKVIFFSTGMITDTGTCIVQQNEAIPPQITSLLIISSNVVVVMPRTILPRRNRRCALSATGMRKPEEEKDARSMTCFMEENKISLREVARGTSGGVMVSKLD